MNSRKKGDRESIFLTDMTAFWDMAIGEGGWRVGRSSGAESDSRNCWSVMGVNLLGVAGSFLVWQTKRYARYGS